MTDMQSGDLGWKSVFVARQPIFDTKMKIWGYELLFRSEKGVNEALVGNDDVATSSVIADGVTLAADGLPADKRLLINFPTNLLLDETAHVLPKERCVIEILEHVKPTQRVLEAVKKLKEAGYTIAVDDYEGASTAALDRFLPLADIVKIDILALDSDPRKVAEAVKKPKEYGCMLLAEKVENNIIYEGCKALGFQLFQGFFFSKPEVIPGKTLSSNELTKLQLLQELGGDFKMKRLAEILATDPSMSYRLFRYINSVGFDLTVKVESLERAIRLLGQRRISQWLRTAIMADLNPQPKAGELAFLSVHRARFFELLSAEGGMGHDPESMFMLGLFSLLDAMLGMNMEDIIKAMPLNDDVEKALRGKNDLSQLLLLAGSYERGLWTETDQHLDKIKLNPTKADMLYALARDWTQKALFATKA